MVITYSALRGKIIETRPAGHLYVAWQELLQRNAKEERQVIFFPGGIYTGTAGDLRARAISHELRTLGWQTILVPPWLGLKARRAIIDRHPSALLFFQQSRHKLNLPSLYPSRKSIFDADDADILLNPDRVIECLKASSAVIAGSNFLANEFKPHNPNVSVVWTGSYITNTTRTENAEERPIIAWAQSDPFDYLHEAELVKNVWLSLAREGHKFSALIYSDEPARVIKWLDPVHRAGANIIVRRRLNYAEFVQSLTNVAIGLQPICPSHAFSRGKSFGKVLAYLAAGVPVIASREVDHELFFRNGENGLLVDSESEWVAACKRLLEDRAEREKLARNAHADLCAKLTTRSATEQIASVLEGVLSQDPSLTNASSSRSTH